MGAGIVPPFLGGARAPGAETTPHQCGGKESGEAKEGHVGEVQECTDGAAALLDGGGAGRRARREGRQMQRRRRRGRRRSSSSSFPSHLPAFRIRPFFFFFYFAVAVAFATQRGRGRVLPHDPDADATAALAEVLTVVSAVLTASVLGPALLLLPTVLAGGRRRRRNRSGGEEDRRQRRYHPPRRDEFGPLVVRGGAECHNLERSQGVGTSDLTTAVGVAVAVVASSPFPRSCRGATYDPDEIGDGLVRRDEKVGVR
mmetsp:Transcript_43239/g.131626  ORF Transcript_43239/g.131626 Transcript_43239/m.131626 type:complete len:257 (+) Transcript_43239:389-1159(+)